MKRRNFLFGSVGASVLGSGLAFGQNSASRPNIVLILADDLGYADVGYHGCEDVPTPHIDSIARAGVRFTDGYANCPVCGPTRAALMTGRYQHRFGCENNIGPRRRSAETKFGLPLTERTIAERLQPLGYRSGCFGKWHLGGEVLGDESLMPLQRGFDEFFGFLEGAALYIDPTNREKKHMRGNKMIRGEVDYYTDALGREAVSFIKRNKENPFFLYLPFNSVHAPMEATEKYLSRFASIKNPLRRKLAAMLSAMDDNIGRVLRTLRTEGLEKNTLVIFMSDNGGKPGNNGSLNDPLRGQKGQYYEGGIRVPWCMKWPGRLKPGMTFSKPVMGIDLLPTIVEAAGGAVEDSWKLDGVDLMPFLQGEKSSRPHETLFWKTDSRFAIRHGDLKLVKQGRKVELFDLARDREEKNDLAAERPETVAQLLKRYRDWDKEMPPANFGWGDGIGKRVEGAWKWERVVE